MAQHMLVPKEGVAIHINAYNFPVWGMLEKIAVNLLAGVPAVVKPATVTCYLTEAVVREIIASNILPDGALQLICGSAGDLLDHTINQDIISFTGSAATGLMLKSQPHILSESVPFNMEADSLNCIVLGEDVTPSMPEWDLFIKEVRKEIIVKAGQKCTAIRRILAPAGMAARVRDDIVDRLRGVVVGNPAEEAVRMGPVATAAQLRDVREGIGRLASDGRLAVGSAAPMDGRGAPAGKGFFVSPCLVEVEKDAHAPTVHSVEVFGPVATLLPYSGAASDAAKIVARGQGGLVSSVYSEDAAFTTEVVLGLAPFHGRIFLGSAKIAEQSPGPGTVLPHLVHGGPGRAGGGEELGGLRGLGFYMQRVALEGSKPVVEKIAGVGTP